jgi:hypothetical protein
LNAHSKEKLTLRHPLVVASIVLLAACSDHRSAELSDKPAATAVPADADGSFALERVEPGAYTLTVYAGGRIHEQPIQIASGRNEVQITMD